MKTSLDQGLSNPASREYLEEDVRKASPMATPLCAQLDLYVQHGQRSETE
jgi:hypothetical protein